LAQIPFFEGDTMSNRMIDALIPLAMFAFALFWIWRFLGGLKREKQIEHQTAPKATQKPELTLEAIGFVPKSAPAQMDRLELDPPAQQAVEAPARLLVRHLADKATVMIRPKREPGGFTGSMIVWRGKKTRKGYTDVQYDLGIITTSAPHYEAAEQFLLLAKEKLEELAAKGVSRRTKKEKAEIAAPVVSPEGQGTCPDENVLDTEDQPDDAPAITEPAIRLRRFRNVFCGVITEIGMMERCKDGKMFEVFGIRLRTQEGVVEELYGIHLQTVLRAARASIGDQVEIIKVGYKDFNNGKAPMNLYQLAKLDQDQ
jgi:hypothetical protein